MPTRFSWVPLPYCSPPGCPFPIKSLALSAHVSPRTIHFRVLDKSPVSGPGRGPPSCNKWRLWRGLFFTETDMLTTRVLRGQLACQWTRPSGHNWDPFVPGLLLMRTTVNRGLNSLNFRIIGIEPTLKNSKFFLLPYNTIFYRKVS